VVQVGARSDARPDSDYDVAVFLIDLDSFGREAGRIAEIETDVLTTLAPSSTRFPSRLGLIRNVAG
jgi:uncharacterized protein